MPVQMICASHSPLMLTDIDATDATAQQAFFDAVADAKRTLEEYDPELVVVFGPDHFNGFFFDLMPMFCIGTAAESTEDWELVPARLDVPEDLAMECARTLHRQDIDIAVSRDMKVDHGITIPLFKLIGTLDRYPVLPIFVNCAADPRPSFRRVRTLGEAVGRFLAETGKRVAVIGSGGLSHDPPTPRIATAPPEVAARLIHRNTPTTADLDARQANVVRCAQELVEGGGPCMPPSEAWDRAFLDKILSFDTGALDAITDDEIDEMAGFGGHEVRCWVAANAAARAMGAASPELTCYRMIPEWITGMGVVVGRG